jgi:flagellar biosynthetic protein FliR
MHVDALFTYATLLGFLFTLARISCVFAFLPLGAFRAAPESAKIVLSLGFTMILWPQWKGPVGETVTIGRIVSGLAEEAALGLAIGLALSIVLEVFQLGAQVVSLQAGFGFASTIDPSSGADSTVLLALSQTTAGLLFFATGADRMLVRALADSLRLCPPESFTINPGWGEALIHFASSIFSLGLRLGAPVIALLLLADGALAVLGRIQNQIHLVSLTMPMKLGSAMLLVASTLTFQPRLFESTMANAIRLIEEMIRSGHR